MKLLIVAFCIWVSVIVALIYKLKRTFQRAPKPGE